MDFITCQMFFMIAILIAVIFKAATLSWLCPLHAQFHLILLLLEVSPFLQMSKVKLR